MRSIYLAAVLALGVATVHAQNTNPPAASTAAPAAAQHAPKLECAEPSFDFGTKDTSETAEHTYLIKNTGDLSLEISNVKPSCGCTVANISEKSVPPGGETKVTARLSLQGRSGQQHKTITVDSNDPKQPQFVLTLQGNVASVIDVRPPSVVFGEVGPDSIVTQLVEVAGAGATPFKVVSVASQSSNFTARAETIEEGKLYRIVITTQGKLPAGAIYGSVRVTTDMPARPVIDIPVSTMVVGALIVAPQELVIARQEQPVTRYIVIRPGTTKEFEIKKVDSPQDKIVAHVFPFGQNGFRIQLDNIIPSADLSGKAVHIATTVDSMKDVIVPFSIVNGPQPPAAAPK